MTEPAREDASPAEGYPLSSTQEFFCSLDQGDDGGAFGLRFIIVSGFRISGDIDVAALQGALDEVVARHELLRTIVARDVTPPCQLVQPPCRVPLEIRDLRSSASRPPDVVAEELIIEAEHGAMNPRQVPLMHALLGRLADRDWVLILSVHHSACDGWSMQLIVRDLAAFYAARETGHPAQLPEVRQYREYAAWQRASLADAAAEDARSYWQETLAAARIFTLPSDHVRPEIYSRPYSAYNYSISAGAMRRAPALATEMRCSLFMVLLAAFNVLASNITGDTDLVVRAFTTGRNEPQFYDTIGLFMNLVPFRTNLAGCTSFRDVVASTRDTCLDAYANEIPIHNIEQDCPDLNLPHGEPRRSQFILGMFQSQFDEATLRIADSLTHIVKRELPDQEHTDIPNGLVWDMTVLASGELAGEVAYNRDEFEEATVAGWTSDYRRILSGALDSPDRAWKTL
jgi:hypothetical protein